MEKQMNVPKLRFPEFERAWDMKCLGDLGEVRMCKRIFNEETLPVGDIPFYKIGSFGNQADAYISKELYSDYRKRFSFPKKGDILISAAGTIGRTVIYNGEDAYYQDSNIVWIDNDNSVVSNNFLLFIYQIVSFNTEGGTIQRLYNSILKSTKFCCPTFPEQSKIAYFLTIVDVKLAQLKKKKSFLGQYKKGVINKLFLQELRFKDEDGNFFPDWEEREIGEVLTVGSGRDYKHLNYGDVPVFGTGGLMNFVDACLFEGETVCIGRKGTIDKPMFYSGKIWTVDTLFFTHSFIDSIPKFLYYVFQCINWKMYNEASGVPSLSKSTIEKIPILIPRIPEQQKIASFLSALDDKIAQTALQIEKMQLWKKGLLQQMFV
jgi:type I restriction enzyme, S subunit